MVPAWPSSAARSPICALAEKSCSRPSAEVPSDSELSALRAQIDDALSNGAAPARKALLQALVHEVRAESRDKIVPWFRVHGGEPVVSVVSCSNKHPTARLDRVWIDRQGRLDIQRSVGEPGWSGPWLGLRPASLVTIVIIAGPPITRAISPLRS